MPLLDHFYPPLDRRSWQSFHGWWLCHLAGQFNMRPNRYEFLAECKIRLGKKMGEDVVAIDEESAPFVFPVDFASIETFEIPIYDNEWTRTLVAVVELVGPGNKDRPEHRRAFLDKCAAYLREGVSVVLVDIVTSRRHNFHKELMELFGCGETAQSAIATDLYAVAYRVRLVGQRTQLEIWLEPLSLGAPLPTMPLWLTESLCVPLELEAGYQAACKFAGIR